MAPTEYEQRGGRGHARALRPVALRGAHRLLDVERPQPGEDQQQADEQRRVAHPGDDEGLPRRRPVRPLPVPEPDQQEAAQPHALPAHEQEQEVVGQHQDEHGGDEQVHVGEEAPVSLVAAHELHRVEKDEKAHEGDHEHHHHGQRVEIEGDARSEAAYPEPGPQDLVEGAPGRRRGDERRRRSPGTTRAAAPVGAAPITARVRLPRRPPPSARTTKPRTGKKGMSQRTCSMVSPSASADRPRRACRSAAGCVSASASPTATSAAATARMKTNIT